jgi:hypothetical protein
MLGLGAEMAMLTQTQVNAFLIVDQADMEMQFFIVLMNHFLIGIL